MWKGNFIFGNWKKEVKNKKMEEENELFDLLKKEGFSENEIKKIIEIVTEKAEKRAKKEGMELSEEIKEIMVYGIIKMSIAADGDRELRNLLK